MTSIPLVRSFRIKNNFKNCSGDFYTGDWYIPDLFYCGSFDKIFKFTNGGFIEFTDKLDTKMIKSYADIVIKDRNGFPLYLPSTILDVQKITNGAINQNSIIDFESFCT